ncbi:MAG: Kinesin light chain 3 [Chrysothrix sp. TS-e1954]|nr:MAG: Kinesin light chain 3 [Chrysothrix sp. TS-e1954]
MALSSSGYSRGGVDKEEQRDWNWQRGLSREVRIDIGVVEAALSALRSFSLIQYRDEADNYTMHKLVQVWGYERLDVEARLALCRSASDFVVVSISQCGHEPIGKSRLVKHVSRSFQVASEARQYVSDDECLVFVDKYGKCGDFLDTLGVRKDSRTIKEFEYNELTDILGDEHPDTISAMNNLTVALSRQGHLDEAASMKREVVEKMRRILGDEHPDTITAMNNLAVTLSDQGHLDEAASMRRPVVKKRRRLLRDEHPDTTTAVNNLAMIHERNQSKKSSILGRRQKLKLLVKNTFGRHSSSDGM